MLQKLFLIENVSVFLYGRALWDKARYYQVHKDIKTSAWWTSQVGFIIFQIIEIQIILGVLQKHLFE